MMRRIFITPFILTIAIASTALGAGEHPDALYQQGRFEEAEKAYAEKDMDSPKDTRFRYNHGCAAYQKADFDGAMASFASVLKRTDSDENRFKATFNLGNTAFKKGDFSSAAAYFKQALALKPESEDARVNLELTLREMGKNKGSQQEQPGNESPKDASQENDGSKDQEEKNEGQKDENDSPQQEEPKGESPEQKPTTADDQSEEQQEKPKKQDETSSSRNERSDERSEDPRQSTEPERQDTAQEPNRDLSGRLEPMEALPQTQEGKPNEETGRKLDQRKADAFLDNVKEDRSRFLQYKLGKEQGRGVASGKDW